MSFHPETENYKYWKASEELELEELVKTGKYSFKDIGKILNRTSQSCQDHSRILDFDNNYIHRKHFHDENFWSIPNPINSYWAGFSSADCNVHRKNNCPVYRLEIQKTDIEHLKQLTLVTKNTGTIYESNRIRLNIKNEKKLYSTVKFSTSGCHQWLEDLENIWNIIPNKTHRLAGPNINDEYLQLCWLQGITDGDGNISISKTTNLLSFCWTSSSRILLEYIKFLIDSQFGKLGLIKKRKANINKTSWANAYRYSVSGIKACVLFDYLHQFPIYRLARKWEQSHVLEYVNQQKLKYPHLFKTLEIPDQWKNFSLDSSKIAPESEINSKISLQDDKNMLISV